MDSEKLLTIANNIKTIEDKFNNSTIDELILSGIFNKYGFVSTLCNTYGPYDITLNTPITIKHEDDKEYTRLIQIELIDKDKRIIDSMSNYAIALDTNATTVIKIKNTLFPFDYTNIQKIYVTIMFNRKNIKLSDNKYNTVIIEDSYIVNNFNTLKQIEPENQIIKGYCCEENKSYVYSKKQWRLSI